MQHKVVSQNEWMAARKALLAKEKEFTKARDRFQAPPGALPWVKVEKNYVFEDPNGRETLSDLFGNKNQLMVYHFMLGPGWVQGCPSCSFRRSFRPCGDSPGPARRHTGCGVARTVRRDRSIQEAHGMEVQMGVVAWQRFQPRFPCLPVYAKKGARQNWNPTTPMTEFPSEEAPGLSAFIKNEAGEVLHTYSSYARGLDMLVGTYPCPDMAPKGRDEDALPWSMAWVRRHDEYGK